MNQQLTVGHKLSMFLDLVVMLLWFLMIKFENKRTLDWISHYHHSTHLQFIIRYLYFKVQPGSLQP